MDEWRVQISQGQNHKDGEYPGEAGGWFLTSGHRQGSVPKSPISKAPVPAQKSQSFARRRCSALYRSIRQEKPDTQLPIRVKTEKKFTGAKIGAIFCKITSRITTKNLKIGP